MTTQRRFCGMDTTTKVIIASGMLGLMLIAFAML
jgi:hypothetical protein